MSETLLEVAGLSAFYGSAQALHDVSFSVGSEPVAIVGRNGMGKTTLCAALMGLTPPRVTGSARFEGVELVGKPSYKIARAGLGYVPQGRRLFPSLTVNEHLRISARGRGGTWTIERVYELFPRLADRKRNGGAELSGGEQQMLAIGRALLGNPRLLIMDEPSEGLAPAVIDVLIETFKKLEEEGLAILLIEQKLDVATSLADRQLVMVGGEIALETTAAELARDPEMQRRFLGVEPVARRLEGDLGSAAAWPDGSSSCSPSRSVALLAGCGGSTEARPDLAFVSTRDGDYAVFEMNADGEGQNRLTEAEAADDASSESVFFQVEPDWSPDGDEHRVREPAQRVVRSLRDGGRRHRHAASHLDRGRGRELADLVARGRPHRVRTGEPTST